MLNWKTRRTKASRSDFWYYSGTDEHRNTLNEECWCSDQDSKQEHVSEASGLEPTLSEVFGCQLHYSLHLRAGLSVPQPKERGKHSYVQACIWSTLKHHSMERTDCCHYKRILE
jgi:hypothetical protein